MASKKLDSPVSSSTTMVVSSMWEEYKEDYTKGMIGLRNNSYYCYMNAVL